MKSLFCLTEQAIRVLKEPNLKAKIMFALGVKDSRTIDKHLKNNSPYSPLLNYNVREIIRDYNHLLRDKEIYRRLSEEDIANICAWNVKISPTYKIQ